MVRKGREKNLDFSAGKEGIGELRHCLLGFANVFGVRSPRENLEVLVYQPAKAFAIFVFHMHKFNSTAIRADVAHYRSEMNLAEARTNFQLNGIADA